MGGLKILFTELKSAVLKRYFTSIRQVKNEAGKVHETYVREGSIERINAGQVECVSSGFGHNLTSAICTMFTEPGLKFSLVGATESIDVTKTAEFFEGFRESSQFLDGMIQADRESFQLGASLLWMECYEGKIKYRTVDPGKVKVRFDAVVESDGEPRPVNYKDLEDATCVIIETGTIDDTNKSFVAIFGRSRDYPDGRYCSYYASSDGKTVPDVGDPGVFDWKIPKTDKVANPLSFYANLNPEENLPEYPLAIFYGGHVRRDRLFPISTSVLEEALEADITASHLRAVSNDHARGARVLYREQKAAGKPLPTSLYGNVSLEPGQKLEACDNDPSGVEVGWTLLKEGNTAAAQGYAVPDFLVSSEDHTLDASSGVALKIRSTGLKKFRSERIGINRPSVDKVFAIEKGLILLFSDAPEATALEDCSQVWEPGQLEFPENMTEVVANVKELVSMGVYDTIEAMQVIYQLPSEQDAINRYEALKKRAEKCPPLNASPVDELAQQGQLAWGTGSEQTGVPPDPDSRARG